MAVAAAGGAVFAAVVDDAQVEVVPGFGRVEFFEVALDLDDVGAAGEFPAQREAVDVSVDGKCGVVEGLNHEDGGGFVADAGEVFEFLEGARNLAGVAGEEEAGHFADIFRLHGREAAGADDGVNLRGGEGGHFRGRVGQGEERGGDLVDAHVGALGGEDDGNEEGEGVAVREGDARARVERGEAAGDEGGADGFGHGMGGAGSGERY